jgi:hypothetical protein
MPCRSKTDAGPARQQRAMKSPSQLPLLASSSHKQTVAILTFRQITFTG